MLCDGLLACSPRPFIFYMTAWWEPNSPGDTTTGSLQTNEQRYLPEELSVIMAALTGRSLGKKNTHDDGLGNNAAQKKRWLWKGLSTASTEVAHYRGSQREHGHWGRQRWTKLRKNGWRRGQSELKGGREETDGAGGDGRSESGRHTAREEDGEGRRASGEWGMGPDVGRECWKDGWMDEGEGTVITGLVVRLERWRRCFFSTATLH